MRRAALVLIAALLVAAPAVDARGGGFSSGGSSRSSGFSSGSKSSGGSKSSYGSGSSKSSGSSKPTYATASKPSTGSKAQPAPVPKLIPPAPPKVGTGGSTRLVYGGNPPPGRSYGRDRSYVISHPVYANPYSSTHYYGYYDSPYFYLWLASLNNGSNRPLPPESDDKVADAVESYMGIIASEANAVTGDKP